MGRDSSVGRATRYGLDGPVGTKFFVHAQAVPGANPVVKAVLVLFPGVKRPRRGVDRPPRLAPRLKKE
jgi:hypothetical protein